MPVNDLTAFTLHHDQPHAPSSLVPSSPLQTPTFCSPPTHTFSLPPYSKFASHFSMDPPPPFLKALPFDVTARILSHLNPSQLSATACISTSWRHHSQDETLWRCFCSTAPEGRARQTYLLDRAWHLARAIHSISPPLSAAVHAVHLLPSATDSVLTASLQHNLEFSLHSVDGFQQVRPVSLLWCRPQCVRLRSCKISGRTYVAYGYANGALVLHWVSHLSEPPAKATVISASVANTVSAVDVLLENGRAAVVGGTANGSLCVAREMSLVQVKLSQHAISSVCVLDGTVLLGTVGGNVILYDVGRMATIMHFVGPCNCRVSGVDFASEKMVVAGFSHSVVGNGHRSAAVAWNAASGERLAAFGRGEGVRSSGALPMVAVGDVRADAEGKRVGLVVGGVVRVYKVGAWRCEVEAEFGEEALGIDMDEGRIAIGVGRRVHVLDFDKAVSGMPEDAKCFQPVPRQWGQRIG